MFIAQLFSAVGFSILFPFFPLYVAELGTTTGLSLEFWSGMVFSSQAITMTIVSPFWGTVADRYGRKLMVERAMFGGAILLLLMAFVQSAEQLVLLRALQGLITGTVSAANSLVAACAPRERMGYAMGVVQVGQWGGIALGPVIGGTLADAFGYRIPFVVTAGLLLISGILVLFGVQENFDRQAAAKVRRSFLSEWRHVVTMAGVMPTFGLRFLNALVRSMLVPILALFIVTLMNTTDGVNSMTGIIIGIESGAATLSAVYLGRLGDRIGHRQIIIASALAATIFYIPQIFVTEAWQLLVLQGMTGIAMGGLIAAPSALLAQYTDPGEEGAVYGIDNSVVSGARAIAPLIGAGIAAWLGYRGVFVVAVILMLTIATSAIRLLPEDEPERQLKTV
jgi:DHA1 family multidrug resistance protein-like MFS transporter